MELRQIRYLDAVVRQGSFTRAAEFLHISQPALSVQIQNLESELGAELLTRLSRGVQPTAIGEVFLAGARRALAELAEAEAAVSAQLSQPQGHLRIGATPLSGPLSVTAVMSRFHRKWPQCSLSLRRGLAKGLVRDLLADELDVVVAPWEGEAPSGFSTQHLAHEELVLISSLTEEVAPTSIADVRERAFACLPPGSGLRALLNEAFAAVGAVPTVPFEVGTPDEIRRLVAGGLGLAMVARSVAEKDGPPVLIHPVDGLPAHPPLVAMARSGSGRPAATERFLDELDAAARAQG